MDHYIENIRLRKTFIKNMRELRISAGFTQERFAEELGVSIKRVGSWEEHRAFPPIEVLVQVSDYFKQDLREMLETICYE